VHRRPAVALPLSRREEAAAKVTKTGILSLLCENRPTLNSLELAEFQAVQKSRLMHMKKALVL
jgi:hypothetical protein